MNNEAAGIQRNAGEDIFVWSNTLLFKPVPESLCERRGGGGGGGEKRWGV